MAAITIAGENLIAQKTADFQTLVVTKFIFALVPGLNPDLPVNRHAGKPPVDQVVYEQDITKGGYVNPNQVVYSAMIGSNIGDWDFNWIGLETAEGVLLAVAYMPIQQKRKNIPNRQIGNNITRNILLMFDGAQSITNLTINANTWQADFTVRLAGIDERERLSNRDLFGRACFFADGLKLVYQSGQYRIQPGTAYVEGLCVKQGVSSINPPALPVTVWYDISLRRYVNETKVMLAVRYGDDLMDFADTDDALHYLVPIARIVSAGNVTDLRDTVEPINGPLIQHLAARIGDYPDLRARATTKDDVDLGNLPNAKSDDPRSNSSDILATTAALFALQTEINDSLGSAAFRDIGNAAGNVPEFLPGGLSDYGYGSKYPPRQVIDFDTFVSVNGQTVPVNPASANSPPGINQFGGLGEFFHNNTGCVLQRVTFAGTHDVGGQVWQRVRYTASEAYGPWMLIYDSLNIANPLAAFAIGVPTPWYSLTPPPGCLAMNGQAFSRSIYPLLLIPYPSERLPDMRGEFIRGLDAGRGVDTGRILLSGQSGQIESHLHGLPAGSNDATGSGWMQASPGNTGGENTPHYYYNSVTSGGNETRPRNIAFSFICRAL
jgi:hypothetical protein